MSESEPILPPELPRPVPFAVKDARRTAKRKQRIVLWIALVFLALFSLPSLSYHISRFRLTPQYIIGGSLDVIRGTIAMLMSPGGFIIGAVLVGFYFHFRPPNDSGSVDDGYELLSHATKLEREGRAQAAIKAYEDIARAYANTSAGLDAQTSLDALRAKISGEQGA
jgi:hypothetical protein